MSVLLFVQFALSAPSEKFVFMDKQMQSGSEDLLIDYWSLFLTMKTTPSGTGKYIALEVRLTEIEDSLKEKGFSETDLSDLSKQANEHYEQRANSIKTATADASFQYIMDKILTEKMKLNDLSGLLLEHAKGQTSSQNETSSFVEVLKFHASKMSTIQQDHFSMFAAKIWLFTELQRRETLNAATKQKILQAAARDFVNFVAVATSDYTSTHQPKSWEQRREKAKFYQNLAPAISEVFIANNFEFDSEMLDLFRKEKDLANKSLKVSGFVLDGIKALRATLKRPGPVQWFRAVGISGVGFMLTFGFLMDNILDGTSPSKFTIGLVGVLWWKILGVVNAELNLVPNFKWYFSNSRQHAAKNRFAKSQVNKLLAVISEAKLCRMAVSK